MPGNDQSTYSVILRQEKGQGKGITMVLKRFGRCCLPLIRKTNDITI